MNQNKERKLLVGQELKVGDLTIPNRCILAPLTRTRADPKTGVPTDIMTEYYTQRASFGFLITECSQISPLSNGFPGSGGIYSKEQIKAWKKITDSVHQKKGKIFHQIWHCGRAVPKEFIDGQQPIGPSALPANYKHLVTGEKMDIMPREMTKEDIQQVIQEFKQGALNAKEAGFDGIELHGANGYLVDQFLRDGSNIRTDEYGGSIENRSRFLLEVLDVLIEVFGSERVGVRLSPTGRYNGQYESNPIDLMKYVLQQIEKKKLAFVEIKRHGQIDSGRYPEGSTVDEKGRTLPQYQIPNFFETMRPLYNGLLIANDGFDPESAQKLLDQNLADMVSFGQLSMCNPDLPERIQNGWEIEKTIRWETAFTQGPEGYTDYPSYHEKKQQNESGFFQKLGKCFNKESKV